MDMAELMDMEDYDMIVVGAGSPGEHCVGELADGGLHVAVVEGAGHPRPATARMTS